MPDCSRLLSSALALGGMGKNLISITSCAETVKRTLAMKTYRGIVKGNTVILEQDPDVQEGTEALVLIQATEDEEQEILQRQKAMLDKGFAMGKVRYKKREELYERGR
jgi:hypothetical protein